jgi:hypothetical protein
MAFQMNVSGISQEDLLCILNIYSITASTLEGGKNHNSAKTWQRPKIYVHLSTTEKLFEKLIL